LIRKRKREYICEQIIECNGDSRKLWNVLNPLIHSKRYIKNREKENSANISADELNEYFVTEPKVIIENNYGPNDQSDETSVETEPTLGHTFSIPLLTEENVIKIIYSFKIRKASGSDGISMRFIKKFALFLTPLLIYLMNRSITSCVFPTAWKISRVSAIHKSGDKQTPNNYRPISNIPIFAKILEKHIFN
jgi:hypothetical protein